MPRLGLFLCPKCDVPCVKPEGCYKHNGSRQAVMKRFYENHKEEIKQRTSKYYHEHKDQMREHMKNYAKERKAKQQEQVRDSNDINNNVDNANSTQVNDQQ